MGRRSKQVQRGRAVFAVIVGLFFTGCTHRVQIEPSDKPFVVNMNVKVQVEEQNRDLLNLEEEVKSPKKSKSGGKNK